MASAAWNWKSRAVDGAQNLLAAYYCGLPYYPYDIAQLTPFRVIFRRGRIANEILGSDWRDRRTTLTVTLRPTHDGQIEWSFNYDVVAGLSIALSGPTAELELRKHLSNEVDGFVAYYSGFAAAK